MLRTGARLDFAGLPEDQVLQAVHASAPQVAFVVFSNSAHPAYRQRYLGAGAAGFLDKSTDFETLPAAIQAAIPASASAPWAPEPGARPRH